MPEGDTDCRNFVSSPTTSGIIKGTYFCKLGMSISGQLGQQSLISGIDHRSRSWHVVGIDSSVARPGIHESLQLSIVFSELHGIPLNRESVI